MKTSERNQKLYELKNLKLNERRILSNARCLSEGVDVPTLSGIAFIDPKQSQIDIIQSVGRSIRKSEDKSKGTIVIPIYISKEDSLNEAILLSNFQKVWQIVIALKSQDDLLMESIDKLRIEKGREGKITFGESLLDKFIFDIPEKITSRFSNSIQTLLVNNTSEDWFEKYGELKRFYEIEGHASPKQKEPSIGVWSHIQRINYKKNNLSRDKICLFISSLIAFPPVFSSVFHTQRAKHLNAKHLSILLHLQLAVLYLKVNVTSFPRTLFAKRYHPIESFYAHLYFFIISNYSSDSC